MDRRGRLQGVVEMSALRFFLSLLLLAFPSIALAAEAEAPISEKAAPPHAVSLMLEPTEALFGVGVVSGEVRLPRRAVFSGSRPMDVSAGGRLAVGRVRASDLHGRTLAWGDCEDLFYCDRTILMTVGGQVLAYPIGSFEHGLQIGAEASFTHVGGTRRYTDSYDDLVGSLARVNGRRVTHVPDQEVSGNMFLPAIVIGYKLVTRPGFTINPQLTGGVAFSEAPPLLAIRLALNVGWSF